MEQSLTDRLNEMNEDLSSLKEDLNQSILNIIKQQSQLLLHKKATLEALNPQNVINRGYSLTVDESGHPVKIETIQKGNKIRTILKDGVITSEVVDVEDK